MTLKQLVFTHTTDCPNRNFKSEVDLDDVQGDVIVQFPKRAEDFTFFKIRDAASFKQHVMPSLIPKISSAAAVMKARENIAAFKSTGGSDLLPLEFVNIAFTYNGLKALGLNADELYASFDSNLDVLKKGQLDCATELGDPVENEVPKEWIDEFKNQHDQIHGVLLVAADSDTTLQKCRADIESKLGNFVQVIYKLQGQTRPGINKDHEHFGWKDGVSNPWLKGVFCECRKFPGQMEVERGNILVGHPGDNDRVDEADAVFPRPDWAKNGSYMAFRQYDQLVPEFHKWTADNAIKLNIPGMSPEQLKERGAALRAAQLVGRWPSGTPLELSPHEDNPSISNNPSKINDFVFELQDQTKCPFSAHIRKVNPRVDHASSGNDKEPFTFNSNNIVRAGIAYGPELEPEEKSGSKTLRSRGLAFVAYQSDIIQGFQFQQSSWANNPDFPPTTHETANSDVWGLDPLIGQNDKKRSLEKVPDARVTIDNQGSQLKFTRFVISRGGAYFFVPPMKTLKNLCTS